MYPSRGMCGVVTDTDICERWNIAVHKGVISKVIVAYFYVRLWCRVPKLLEDLQRYLREAAVMAERESNVKELARNSNAFKKAVEMANILSRVSIHIIEVLYVC